MRFSLIKAIKNTHRHPANRLLHAIGLLLYFLAILMILMGYFKDTNTNPFNSLILFAVAIALFLLGHRIEGNLGATTWVIIFKYLKAKIKNRNKENTRHEGN
jgi:NhaP-type Na+/H+ or K+/H+ antiporter